MGHFIIPVVTFAIILDTGDEVNIFLDQNEHIELHNQVP